MISMDTIVKAVISVPDIGPDECHHRTRIILVAPDSEDHFSRQISIISKHVAQLLFDQDPAGCRELGRTCPFSNSARH
jgi:hypothetical protein